MSLLGTQTTETPTRGIPRLQSWVDVKNAKSLQHIRFIDSQTADADDTADSFVDRGDIAQSTLSTVFSDTDRQAILRYFVYSGRQAAQISELVEYLIPHTQDEIQPTDTDYMFLHGQYTAALYNEHIPKLEAVDIITYHHPTATITYQLDRFDELEVIRIIQSLSTDSFFTSF
ncbi:DUF7344 domain-containing protein [Natronocalculus amylovorans]|uniref:DUF7344 domain-containing protein n=1 Tax=Natronocalculus amylovorans TaxID=2917812 RepID=UPI003CCD5DB8